MTNAEAESLAAFINERDPRFSAEVIYSATDVPAMAASVECRHREGARYAATYHFAADYTFRARQELGEDAAFLAVLDRWLEAVEGEGAGEKGRGE